MYAFMADIHIGAKFSNDSLFKSLDSFLNILKEHPEPCDYIFCVGDLFDHKLSVEEAKVAAVFLARLACNYCGPNNTHAPVHFIHGTYSHDREQYEMFLPLIERIDGAEVYYTDKTDTAVLKTGAKILYLPQVYGKNISYDEYFNQEYDIIIGHGPISSLTKAPCPATDYDILHSAEQLGSISKICMFGHYHGFTDFGNNVFYTGPWLRWKYGEDEPRKFVICTNNFEIQTFPNPFAIEFKTINIGNPEELRAYISQNLTTPHRFCIGIDDTNIDEYHSIMNINKNNQNISYKISSIKKEESIEEPIVVDKDRSVNEEPVGALISYIQDKYGIDTTLEVRDYESRINKEEIK